MDSSTKRKVGAIALIVAGIGAFLVPFLLHSPGLQASNNGGGNNGGSPACISNCTTPACTSNCSPPTTCTTNCSTDTPGTCTADPSSDNSSDHDNQGKHVAKGHDGDQGNEGKHLALGHDKQDASIVAKAQSFMHAMGKHNPQHDATHSTKIDNDTVKNHTAHSDNDDGNDTGACADTKGNDDSDDQGNDD